MSLNITILAECWDAIVQLASEHDKNDLWKSLRRAATRGDAGLVLDLSSRWRGARQVARVPVGGGRR